MTIKIIIENTSPRSIRNIRKLIWNENQKVYLIDRHTKIVYTGFMKENELYFCTYSFNYFLKNKDEIIEFRISDGVNELSSMAERKFREVYLKFGDYNKTLKFLML